MRRLALAALAGAALAGCSLLTGGGQPVLAVELEPAAGFTLDAAGLEEARTVLQKRLDAASRNARVTIHGTKIVVELDAKAAADWPDMKSTILARSALSFLPVATNPPFMEELLLETRRAGIEALEDEWAKSASDKVWTFRAPAADLKKLVATVTSSDPRWDVVVDDSGSHKSCRECVIVVDRQSGMDGVRVTSAQPDSDDWSSFVRVTLSPADATRFEALTASNVNRKVAIVLDGVATSIPVVQEAIAGGNVQILMGRGKSLTNLQREARALSAALASGTLPAPLIVTKERAFGGPR